MCLSNSEAAYFITLHGSQQERSQGQIFIMLGSSYHLLKSNVHTSSVLAEVVSTIMIPLPIFSPYKQKTNIDTCSTTRRV